MFCRKTDGPRKKTGYWSRHTCNLATDGPKSHEAYPGGVRTQSRTTGTLPRDDNSPHARTTTTTTQNPTVHCRTTSGPWYRLPITTTREIWTFRRLPPPPQARPHHPILNEWWTITGRMLRPRILMEVIRRAWRCCSWIWWMLLIKCICSLICRRKWISWKCFLMVIFEIFFNFHLCLFDWRRVWWHDAIVGFFELWDLTFWDLMLVALIVWYWFLNI